MCFPRKRRQRRLKKVPAAERPPGTNCAKWLPLRVRGGIPLGGCRDRFHLALHQLKETGVRRWFFPSQDHLQSSTCGYEATPNRPGYRLIPVLLSGKILTLYLFL